MELIILTYVWLYMTSMATVLKIREMSQYLDSKSNGSKQLGKHELSKLLLSLVIFIVEIKEPQCQ